MICPPTPNSGEENQLQSTQLFKQENYNTSIQQRLIFFVGWINFVLFVTNVIQI